MTLAEDILPPGLSAAYRRSRGARFRRVALQVSLYPYLVRYAVREMVEEILEGGREAFGTRRRKYGF
jgi:hypothetical protein